MKQTTRRPPPPQTFAGAFDKTAADAPLLVGSSTDAAAREARASGDPLIAGFLEAVSEIRGIADASGNTGGNHFGTTASVRADGVHARVMKVGFHVKFLEFGTPPHRIAPKKGHRLKINDQPIGVDSAVMHPGITGNHALASAMADSSARVAAAVAGGILPAVKKAFDERASRWRRS